MPMVTMAPASSYLPVVATGASTASNQFTWQAWNWAYTTGTTTTGVAYQPQTVACSATSTSTAIMSGTWTIWNTTYEETREQREARELRAAEAAAERERRYAEQRARDEERRLEREVANARAEELLLSLLSDEQAATYREHGWFEVRGNRGGRWRIRNRGQSGNVDLMPEIGEEREASYCAHPPEGLPDADAYVAQMLHLVTDEEGFRRVANVQYRRPETQAA